MIAARLANGEGPLGRLLASDETVLDDLKAAIASFKTACDSFDVSGLKGEASDVLARAGTLVDSLNVVAARLANGEGTLGRLSADDTLYKEIEGLVRDLRQVLDNYRDTTPISTFTSIATGAL